MYSLWFDIGSDPIRSERYDISTENEATWDDRANEPSARVTLDDDGWTLLEY
jgi:hypothetical protein